MNEAPTERVVVKHTRTFSMTSRYAAAIAIVILPCSIGVWAVAQSGERSAVTRPALRSVTPRGALLPTEQATVDLFEKARASVVYISTTEKTLEHSHDGKKSSTTFGRIQQGGSHVWPDPLELV